MASALSACGAVAQRPSWAPARAQQVIRGPSAGNAHGLRLPSPCPLGCACYVSSSASCPHFRHHLVVKIQDLLPPLTHCQDAAAAAALPPPPQPPPFATPRSLIHTSHPAARSWHAGGSAVHV